MTAKLQATLDTQGHVVSLAEDYYGTALRSICLPNMICCIGIVVVTKSGLRGAHVTPATTLPEIDTFLRYLNGSPMMDRRPIYVVGQFAEFAKHAINETFGSREKIVKYIKKGLDFDGIIMTCEISRYGDRLRLCALNMIGETPFGWQDGRPPVNWATLKEDMEDPTIYKRIPQGYFQKS